jgi:hypothetical protein
VRAVIREKVLSSGYPSIKALVIAHPVMPLAPRLKVRTTVSGHKSKRKTRKPRFYAFPSYQLQQMKAPGAPRQPLGEVSPN